MSILERFDALACPEPNSGCLLWEGPYTGNGYGAFYVNGKQMPAHRAALVLREIDIPPGAQVMHRCDTKACVNPDHLTIGTRAENMADMARKRRGRKGPLPYGVKRRGGRFVARAFDAGRRGGSRWLGTFDTVEEAASVAEAARKGAQ